MTWRVTSGGLAVVNTSFNDLSSALVAYAQPGLQPRDLLKAVRRNYPFASRTEVVRAAYHAVLELADADLDKARALQDFAIRARTLDGWDYSVGTKPWDGASLST
jgi:hypothetical protein